MLELEEARARLLQAIEPLPTETVPTSSALGRVLAQAISAAIPLPPFDNAAMDGYAVRSEDVREASPGRPVPLRLAGQIAAGESSGVAVEPGTCMRLFTGTCMPRGADAVVMQEDTRVDPDSPGLVRVLDIVKPWENVRLRGEDIKAGSRLCSRGERLTAGKLGLLAATGVSHLTVGCRPVVGLISTGNELVEAGQPLPPGKIFESNRALLAPCLASSGAVAHLLPIVEDTLEGTRRALERALNSCDAVVTSGGVSVGEKDFVKEAFEKLGGTMEFWQVAIKPGKPFCFGRLGTKLLFGLPGNPVSAAVTCLLLVRPGLWKLQGATDVAPETTACTLAESLSNRADRRHFMRVRVDESGKVHSAGGQASHLLGSLAAANGLVEVRPGQTLAAGAWVPVIRFGD